MHNRSFKIKRFHRILLLASCSAFCAIILASCGTMHHFEKTEDSLLISASSLSDYMNNDDVVIVDMRSEEDYAASHLDGAVNITTSDIVINVPVQNMLTSKKKIASIMGENGISNDKTVIAYDSDKISAPRLLWSLYMYGFDKVRIVDGGFDAISEAGLEINADTVDVKEAEFVPGDPTGEWNVTMKDVRTVIDEEKDGVTLLDVRSEDEYLTEGKIPTAVMRNYTEDFYEDGRFKSKGITRVNYVEAGIYPEDEIIIYCKSSFRAAASFVALYEAGYRNIKLYDGAFIEWSSNSSNPIEMPAGAAAPSKKDAS